MVEPASCRELELALWNDTAFLARLGVMDYSLLVGIDRWAGRNHSSMLMIRTYFALKHSSVPGTVSC